MPSGILVLILGINVLVDPRHEFIDPPGLGMENWKDKWAEYPDNYG